MEETRKVRIKVNEQELEVPADWSVIRACHEHGIGVPHYCYHQDLSVAGNCRMCLVKVKNLPKPVIACGTAVSEGMEVDTISDEVVKARSSVMEFLLINHPLDCPECDQAGECRLQDYSYTYGRDHGRFQEEKVVRRKASLGPHVKYWGSRCIVCTRCVRFTDEVSGTGELTVSNRGDRSEIQVFPGMTLDNPLSMNVVDICPVGALVSADFLYKQRAWYLNRKPSLCADCSVGCNTRIDSDRAGNIMRIVPRRNDQVNKEWMCDHGRLSFEMVHRDRLTEALIRGASAEKQEAVELAAALLAGARRPLILVSAWTPLGGLEAAKKLKETVAGARISAYAKAVQADQVFPGFTISGDRNPNRRGVARTLGIENIEADLKSQAPGDIVLVIGNIPDFQPDAALQALLDGAEKLIVLDFGRGALVEHARTVVALPTVPHYERDGVFINRQGIEQRFEAAVPTAGEGRDEVAWLAELAVRVAGGAPAQV